LHVHVGEPCRPADARAEPDPEPELDADVADLHRSVAGHDLSAEPHERIRLPHPGLQRGCEARVLSDCYRSESSTVGPLGRPFSFHCDQSVAARTHRCSLSFASNSGDSGPASLAAMFARTFRSFLMPGITVATSRFESTNRKAISAVVEPAGTSGFNRS